MYFSLSAGVCIVEIYWNVEALLIGDAQTYQIFEDAQYFQKVERFFFISRLKDWFFVPKNSENMTGNLRLTDVFAVLVMWFDFFFVHWSADGTWILIKLKKKISMIPSSLWRTPKHPNQLMPHFPRHSERWANHTDPETLENLVISHIECQ